ncbi:hypothetical protein [Gordonia araii]|nr:hypothetical protein [Gordonia araii]NNG97279.1 hypothetical protein [Gordonia araii NBRC 100433]
MSSKSVIAAVVAAIAVAVVVVARRRLSGPGATPVAPEPPRVTDFTR